MKQIIKLVEKCDQFGAAFQLSLSFYGGLASILINFTGLAYFCYLIFIWQSGQILPKMTNQIVYKEEGSSIQLEQSPFLLQMLTSHEGLANQYKQIKQLYKNKVVVYSQGGFSENVEQTQPLCDVDYIYEQDYAVGNPICLDFDQGNQSFFEQYPSERANDTYVSYYLSHCEDCISNDTYKELLSQIEVFGVITLFTYEFDREQNQIQRVPTDYYFSYSPKQTIEIYLKLKKQTVVIDDGFFFPNKKYYSFINEIELSYQYIDQSPEFDISIETTMDRRESQLQVQHVKIGEVIAQFSSIFSSLLIFGYLFSMLNNHMRKQFLIENLCKMYFPAWDFEKKQQEKSLKAVQPQSCRKQYKQKIMEKIIVQAQKKLNIMSILQDIFIIQKSIMTLINSENLSKIQKAGYKLPQEVVHPRGQQLNEEEGSYRVQNLQQLQLFYIEESLAIEDVDNLQPNNAELYDENLNRKIGKLIMQNYTTQTPQREKELNLCLESP